MGFTKFAPASGPRQSYTDYSGPRLMDRFNYEIWNAYRTDSGRDNDEQVLSDIKYFV